MKIIFRWLGRIRNNFESGHVRRENRGTDALKEPEMPKRPIPSNTGCPETRFNGQLEIGHLKEKSIVVHFSG